MAEEKKRNRWLPRIVLAFSAVALLGVSVLPYLNTPQNAPVSVNSPSPDAQRKQFEDQLRGYESVLQREPENPNALRGIVDAKRGLNDIKGTVEPLEKLVKLNPTVPDYAVLLARTKQYLKDDEGAIQVYREALKSKPADLKILSELSQLLVKQSRPEAAIGLLQDTLRDAPKVNQATPGAIDTTAIEVLLGRTLANQKRFDEAVRVFDSAIKGKPDDFQAYLGKALTLQEQGKKDEAKGLFDKALSVAPPEVKDQISRLAAGPIASPSPTAGGIKPNAAQPAENPSDKPTDAQPDAKPEVPAPAKP
ncbi:MAG: tetratricopeptide repeat protein [Cyanobacteria bacterium]|nr:tetratricopeptide repeat protein [Cyanobacteriota bacterium]